jgi:homoserine kinase
MPEQEQPHAPAAADGAPCQRANDGQVRVFAPASVSNVACGFDAFGFAVEGLGDEVTATLTDQPGVTIASCSGEGGRLPLAADRNTAGRAASAVLERLAERRGVVLHITKRMPLSSGLGSSAASAVAGAVATDLLCGGRLDRKALLRCALWGERLASGSEHADNVAPSLLGGFVLVRALDPEPDLIDLPVPAGLACALVKPSLEIETLGARAMLGTTVELKRAVHQWANTAALTAGLFRSDLGLIERALEDYVAEPARAALVPGFYAVKAAARDAGALGCSLSGSGPTLFALCADRAIASRVADVMRDTFAAHGLAAERWVSLVGAKGAQALAPRPLGENVAR